jgi:hypothetical protein
MISGCVSSRVIFYSLTVIEEEYNRVLKNYIFFDALFVLLGRPKLKTNVCVVLFCYLEK